MRADVAAVVPSAYGLRDRSGALSVVLVAVSPKPS